MGRLASVHFGSFDAYASQQVMVGGVESDGTATAVSAKTATAVRAKTSLEHTPEPQETFPRGHALVRVNTSHPDMQGVKLRSPEPWAALLNKGIQTGLKQAAHEQLTTPKLDRRATFTADKLLDVSGATLSVIVLPEFSLADMPFMLPAYMAVMGVLDVSGISRYVLSRMPRGKEYDFAERSLVPGLPYDRRALAKLLGSRTLVKATA
jgi:hypothetical protein